MIPVARAGTIALTIAIGGLGSWLFAALHLPVPMLSGAMAAVAIAAIAGVRCDMTPNMRDLGMLVSGVGLGSTVTPDTLNALQRYPVSLAGLALSVVLVVASSRLVLMRLFRWDGATAFLASVPGALTIVMTMAAESTADVRKVAILQSMRLFVLMAILPSLITTTSTLSPVTPPPVVSAAGMAVLFALTLAAASWMATRRVPNPLFLAGMFISMALHMSGLVEGTLPDPIGLGGIFLIGLYCGLRFEGTAMRDVIAILWPSTLSLAATLAATAVSAYAVHAVTGLRLAEVLVAFAPGAAEAMILVGAALGLDTLYLSSHHILRMVALNAVTPLFAPRRPDA